MENKEKSLHRIEVILKKEDGSYERLMPTQISNIPHKGDFFAIHGEKKVFEILAVIYEDISTILLVSETDSNFSEIISVVYNS